MRSMHVISSVHNPHFKFLKYLADSASQRRASQQTLLDGDHLIEALLASGSMPLQLLLGDITALAYWQTRCPQIPIVQMTIPLLAALSPVKTPSGVMALIDIPKPVDRNQAHCAILLEKIQDPGNLGSMLRSAAAAGVEVAYLSTGCADAWSPKVLRGGMGAHFALQIIEQADLSDIAQHFNGVVYSTVLDAPVGLYACDLTGPVAFAFGNEGVGLSSALQQVSHQAIHIPMPGQMESLNAATALAVCLFERVRQMAVV